MTKIELAEINRTPHNKDLIKDSVKIKDTDQNRETDQIWTQNIRIHNIHIKDTDQKMDSDQNKDPSQNKDRNRIRTQTRKRTNI